MEDLKPRTRRFAVDVIRYCGKLPTRTEYAAIGRQLVRCATSIGANYRPAMRTQSHARFFRKLSIVEEEADELLRIFVAAKKASREHEQKMTRA